MNRAGRAAHQRRPSVRAVAGLASLGGLDRELNCGGPANDEGDRKNCDGEQALHGELLIAVAVRASLGGLGCEKNELSARWVLIRLTAASMMWRAPQVESERKKRDGEQALHGELLTVAGGTGFPAG
jgi:hypothetical protein